MRVAILGCGYVGLELGRQLLVAGHDPVGVRRSQRGLRLCEAAGFHGVAADLTDPGTLESVPDVDAVAYTASPTRDEGNDRAVRVHGIRDAVAHFGARSAPPTKLVTLSSTGVYGDRRGETVDEETPIDPQTDREQLLFDAETAAREAAQRADMTGTVVRLGGIYGPGRYRIERYLDGPVAAGTMNLIHREDAAGVVHALLEADGPPATLCAVDDELVDKHELARYLADACGVPHPPLVSLEERLADGALSERRARRLAASKRVSPNRRRKFGYTPRFPTFRVGYRPAIRAFGGRESS